MSEASADILIVGGGPAGLMAAEVASRAGRSVILCDAMPTFGRKFLLAGKSGLNITHSEDYAQFRTRFGKSSHRLSAALDAFQPNDVREWAALLGTETFVGTSGRVFPNVMKASPLLRAWIARLREQGVSLLPRHRMVDLAPGSVLVETPHGSKTLRAKAVLMALGGASWPKLGSDATWVPLLSSKAVSQVPFLPANCGFDASWNEHFRERFAGEPVKSVAITSAAGTSQGEFVISRHGVEGSLIYAHAQALREQWLATGRAALQLDLAPGRSQHQLQTLLERQAKGQSFSNRLRKLGLSPVKIALLRDHAGKGLLESTQGIAEAIKALLIPLDRPRPIEEAISSAGGISWSALNDHYMLKNMPGIFAAGEMIDWEAPTGGYLLTACFATGRAAAKGMLAWLSENLA